jgi:hypothetical protein
MAKKRTRKMRPRDWPDPAPSHTELFETFWTLSRNADLRKKPKTNPVALVELHPVEVVELHPVEVVELELTRLLLTEHPQLLLRAWSLDEIEMMRWRLVCKGLWRQENKWVDVFKVVSLVLKGTPAEGAKSTIEESYDNVQRKLPAAQRRHKVPRRRRTS